jgi:16S rRNA processing protein RimM
MSPAASPAGCPADAAAGTATDTPAAAALPPDAVEVGRIAGAWGVQGALRVHAHAGAPLALRATRCWFLQPPLQAHPTRVAAPPLPARLDIVSVREQGQALVATARGLADRAAAEALRGARILVSRASFPPAAPGEYYWVDLIGCRVVNREGVELGVVADLIDIGPHAVLQVRPDAAAAERLIPFVDAYLDEVDTAARRIRVDWSADD